MKKASVLFIILILVFMVSCASTAEKEPSDAHCRYALGLALSKAQEKALSGLFSSLSSSENGIPEQFSMIEENKENIPGMDHLIGNWSSCFRDYVISCFDDFSELTNPLVSRFSISDAHAVLAKGNQSVSELFRADYEETVYSFFSDYLKDMDTALWDKTTSHYNSWIQTLSLLGETDKPGIPDTDIRDALASMLCNLYFNTLSHEEELYRTTPDPYADEISAEVFGLR